MFNFLKQMKGDTAKSGAELELNLKLMCFPASSSTTTTDESSSLESSNASSEMSCVSSSSEEAKPMVLVGCLGCLMYVLLSGADPNPKCPNCNSRVLLDILKNEKINNPIP
ncbi:uncharacterized protein DS421_18g607870 [Arachis hypogaea]|nr:uncharacterized protein DS421_18g607870 [Arachis hypogaea]